MLPPQGMINEAVRELYNKRPLELRTVNIVDGWTICARYIPESDAFVVRLQRGAEKYELDASDDVWLMMPCEWITEVPDGAEVWTGELGDVDIGQFLR